MDDVEPAIVACPSCGAKNRVRRERMAAQPKCGRCGAPLHPDQTQAQPPLTLRCTQCGAKNRVRLENVEKNPRCGRCKTPLALQEVFRGVPEVVTDANFQTTVAKSPLPVLMFCWAPWCPSCGAVVPIVDAFAAESKGRVRVAKLNVEANPRLSAEFNIMSVPQFLIFDRGRMMESVMGGLQKHEMMMRMAKYL